jgi:hypothetical protein
MERVRTKPHGTDFKAIINQTQRDEMAEFARQLSVAENEGMYDKRESEPIELKAGVAGPNL